VQLRTLKEQWNKLKQVHIFTEKVQLTDLLKQFFTYWMKMNENVHEIVSRLTFLQTEILTISSVKKLTDNIKIMILFKALNDAFKVITEILWSTEESDFDKIVKRLCDMKKFIAVRNKSQTESALAIKKNWSCFLLKF